MFSSAHIKLDVDVQSVVAAPATTASALMVVVRRGARAAAVKRLCVYSTSGSISTLRTPASGVA
eukprot:640206-Prymnesium_polylepis.1